MVIRKKKKEDVAIITSLKVGDLVPEQDPKNKNKQNWIISAKDNIKKIKSSPYASLHFSLKVRKVIVISLIIYIAYMGYNMVVNYQAQGFMNTIGRVIMAGVFIFICWTIYKTIPMAQKQIDYYKKYPHLINYCPTDTRETVDAIMKKISENKEREDANKKV
jgi:hypothetical protein